MGAWSIGVHLGGCRPGGTGVGRLGYGGPDRRAAVHRRLVPGADPRGLGLPGTLFWGPPGADTAYEVRLGNATAEGGSVGKEDTTPATPGPRRPTAPWRGPLGGGGAPPASPAAPQTVRPCAGCDEVGVRAMVMSSRQYDLPV